MELNLVSHDDEVSSALVEFATEKFKPLEKRYPHITNANIIFETTSVAATLLMNGAEIHAKVVSEDKFNAIIALTEKLLGLVNKQKKEKI